MPRGKKKDELVGELISEFRTSGNLDRAFDNRAAEVLGIGDTDLHCLNIIENNGGLTAGVLAAEAGLTTGAVTGVLDRLERAGYARRRPDPADRRRVVVEVTERFYERAAKIWGPMAARWAQDLGRRFTAAELELITRFLSASNELTRLQLERISELR